MRSGPRCRSRWGGISGSFIDIDIVLAVIYITAWEDFFRCRVIHVCCVFGGVFVQTPIGVANYNM